MTINPAGLDVRCWNGVEIQRRPHDGYVNATAMCQANGKAWKNYRQNDRTQAYLSALAKAIVAETPCGAAVGWDSSRPQVLQAKVRAELVQVITTGPNHLRGTWIHPRLAVDLARWISPEFAVWMDGWFLEAAQQQAPPPTPPVAIPALSQPAIDFYLPGLAAEAEPTAWDALVDTYAREVEEEQEALPESRRSRSRRFARPLAAHFMQWIADRHAVVIVPATVAPAAPMALAPEVEVEREPLGLEPPAVVLPRRAGRRLDRGDSFQPGDRLAGPELARLLGIDPQTLNDWARRQPLGAVRDGWQLIGRGKFACGPMGSTVPPGMPSWLFEKV